MPVQMNEDVLEDFTDAKGFNDRWWCSWQGVIGSWKCDVVCRFFMEEVDERGLDLRRSAAVKEPFTGRVALYGFGLPRVVSVSDVD